MRPLPYAFLLAALLALPAAAQTTWHVDVHATAPGNGSASSPYTSIQYAIDHASTQSGDTLLVAPGLYVENIQDATGEFLNIVATGGPSVTKLKSANPQAIGVHMKLSRIEGFMVTGNSTGASMGALRLSGGTAVRCVVRDNLGVQVVSSNGGLFECTVLGNMVVESGPPTTMRNTIVTAGITVVSFTTLNASYCAGFYMQSGTGNIIGDPGMWNSAGAEHLLAPGSACIDAGDPSSPPDPDGSPADIGAIPFDPNFDPITTWYVDVHATPPGNGSAASPFTSLQQALAQPATLSGDTVLVAPGTYVEKLELKKNVRVLASGGPLETEIKLAALHLLWGGTLEGFTLTGSIDLDGSTAKKCVLGPSIHSYSGTLLGCTVVGGIFVECFTSITMRNTIVTGSFNPGCMGPQINYCAGPDPDLDSGTGNVIGNPGLWSLPGAEYLLAPGSPCIDAGDPSSPPDPDGSPADIGAIPFDAEFAPVPTIYCTAKPSSLGCVPAIGFQGHATMEGDVPFVVSASQVHPNAPGLLFYGPGAHFLPFQGGWHCVNFPTPRVGAQAAAGSGLCGGTYTFDFAAHLAGGASQFVSPGATLACQWWSRDPADPLGFGTTLTDALLFGVAP